MSPQPVPELEALVGAVAIWELWGPGDPDQLWPAERPLVERAVESRVLQFAAGRQCARAALAAIGLEPVALTRGRQRSVAWPPTVWGAISHTDGYAAAAVGRRAQRSGPVGIDAERVGRVESHLHPRLFVAREQAWLSRLAPADRALAATELFGLKECYYKAQFPLTGAWVGFHDVEVIGPAPTAFGLPQREWELRAITELPALDAVAWPCRGWSMPRGSEGSIALTVAAATASG